MKNSYDEIKGMLNKIRYLSESKNNLNTNHYINEQKSSQNMLDDILVVNNVEIKILTQDQVDLKLMDNQKDDISALIDNFKQDVSQIVNFTPGLTITNDQIRLDGTLLDDSIKFVFIAGNESGAYVNAEMLKLEQTTANILEKLAKFQLTFESTMNEIIDQRKNN